MFGWMMPRGPEKLGISNLNFGGMGAAMMKLVMKSKNVTSLPDLIQTAREQGIKMSVCTMSMDVMGITEEELVDGLEFAGVATYLGEADEANVNLFI
jgi:peroxiredoxin family protein